MKGNILVTGGAGYIGSHAVRALTESGRNVVVYDDFSRGHAQAVAVPVVRGDITDVDRLANALQQHGISAVMHFAAGSQVGESQLQPLKYYRNNVMGSVCLLEAMQRAGVQTLVFSSSAAVYGNAPCPILESTPKAPTNVYGRTKWMMEQTLADVSAAGDLRYVALRYFNAAGAHPQGDIGEDHTPETHLIPLAIAAAMGTRPALQVFGGDYATPDGTCLRDYIHVCDLAKAHLLALDYLEAGGKSTAFNLGGGAGVSVLDILHTVQEVTGLPVPHLMADRRSGDPERLVADAARIRAELGYAPDYPQLSQIIATAWTWHRAHPQGYEAFPCRPCGR